MFTIDKETIDKINSDRVDQQRRAAYVTEADPLFFKYQRGEATEQDWLDKIAEIKARYPEHPTSTN